ncbi:MAG TPA: hypothetical protein DCO79_08190 [Spirochaeta sp.]|nr:hypothetical protein [Spirochaeta sp.]
MKRLQLLLMAILVISISSCTTKTIGPPGPQGDVGPAGPTGAAGESAFVFEYSNVDFVGPDYDVFLNYPADFEGLESDVTLVYLLWETTTDGDGNALEVWRQVPQTIFTQNGLINYNFDFTRIDFHLFLTTEFDPVLLEPIDTDDWIVRAVIVPGDFWGGRTSVDHSDYYAVQKAYGLPDMPARSATDRRK